MFANADNEVGGGLNAGGLGAHEAAVRSQTM